MASVLSVCYAWLHTKTVAGQGSGEVGPGYIPSLAPGRLYPRIPVKIYLSWVHRWSLRSMVMPQQAPRCEGRDSLGSRTSHSLGETLLPVNPAQDCDGSAAKLTNHYARANGKNGC